MQSLARNGYTAEQVKAALHSDTVMLTFRYDLLDKVNAFKKRLDNVLAGSVAYNALADIKRTARFLVEDDGTIDFLSDRIKPWVRVLMLDGGWVEFPQGVFLLTTPPRKVDSAGVITRDVEAYDLLQVLADDKVTERYTVIAGTNYIAAVRAVLDGAGLHDQNLNPTTKTLPADRDWDLGTPKLKIINDLLGAIAYRSLWMDENGCAVAQPYVSPSDRAPEYDYRDDDKSVIFPEAEQGLDPFGIPNQWILTVSEPDRPPLRSVYTNTNPNSTTSTVSRGRTITDPLRQVEAADQASLDDQAARLAFEASQVFEEVALETGIMPFHSDSDVFTLRFSALGINAKYSETEWSMDLKAGARMKHYIRRVVDV